MKHEYKGKKPDHISPSQIETGKCLFRYLKLRLEKSIPNENLPMKLGRAKHKFIFLYTKKCRDEKMDSDFEYGNKIIDKVFNENKLPESVYQEYRENMLAFAQKGIEHEKICDCEKKETVTIGQDEQGQDIKLEFIIDRVNLYTERGDTILEIMDYKQSYNVLSRTDVEKNQQLNIYRYLACNYLYKNNAVVSTGIYHIKHLFCRWSDRMRISGLSEEFENTEKFLHRQWDRLHNSEEYPPERGEYCFDYGGCAVMTAGKCPLYSVKEIEKMKKGSIEDKVHLYRKLNLDAKKLKPEIMEYFKNNPPAEIDEVTTGYKTSISYKYILEKFLKFCEKYKNKIGGLLVSKDEVNKILEVKHMPDNQVKDLEKCREENITTRFQI